MKNIINRNLDRLAAPVITGAILLLLPVVTFAEKTGLTANDSGGPLGKLITNVLGFINNIIIPAILGLGFLMFVWGIYQYLIAGGASDEAQKSGKKLMLWATLGFVIIIIFWGVVNIFANTTGLQNEKLKHVPNLPDLRSAAPGSAGVA